jgi:hypothetical protein
MKTCDQASELLPALAENMLGGAEADEVRAHIASCAACAESWKLQELIGRHFQETDLAADRPDYFWTKQRKHILDEVGWGTARFEQASPARRPVLKFALAAAAAALLIVGIFSILKPNTAPSRTDRLAKDKTPVVPKDSPVVQDPPKETTESPAPKEELVEKNDPPKEDVTPPAPENQVVEKNEPKPGPENEAPKKKELVQEPKKENETKPQDPPKETPPPVKPEAVAILPGHAKYPTRLAAEQAEILIPLSPDTKTPQVKDRVTTEQAMAFLKAGKARLDDMEAMFARDPNADLTEMVDAYAILVGEGAATILYQIGAENRSSPGARAELRAQQVTLAKFPQALRKGVLSPAIHASTAAIQLKIRRHKSATSGPESGALIAARETVAMLEGSNTGVLSRAKRGFAIANRYVQSIMANAKLGRMPQVEGEYEAYQRVVDAVVRMLEWLEPRDQEGTCSRARIDLTEYRALLRRFNGPEPVKRVIDAAIEWTTNMIAHVTKMEQFYQGKIKDLPRRDSGSAPPPPPPQAPPPPKDPPPKFGEDPEPPPSEPPKGEGFDEPK